jgi:hypothetical protein
MKSATARAAAIDAEIDVACDSIRRRVVAELKSAGFWPSDSLLASVHEDQRARGSAALSALFGDRRAVRHSHQLQADATAARIPLRRLQMVAGFGHQLSSGLARVAGVDPQEHSARQELSAAFFLFTALFDTLLDGGEPFTTRLLTIFDLPMVRLLLADPERAQAELRLSPGSGQPAFRILFETAIVCFTGIANQGTGANADLREAVEACYRSEVATVRPGLSGKPTTERSEDLSTKSKMPFVIVARLVCGPRERMAETIHVAEILGKIFWRVDDVADLADDIRAGEANAMLRRMMDGGFLHNGLEASAFANSEEVGAQWTTAIRGDLVTLFDALAPLRVRMDGGWRFEDWILCAIRGWLEPRRGS